MKAQVTEIKFNVEFKGKYKVTELHSLTEKGKNRKDIIFQNSDMFPVVKTLKVGDNIDLKMKQNGDFWNVVGVEKLSDADVAATPSTSTNNYSKAYNNPERDTAITRMSVLKTATDLITNCLAQGMYKKAITPEILVDDIFKYAYEFEQYVQGQRQKAELASTMDDITQDTSDDDDLPFDTE